MAIPTVTPQLLSNGGLRPLYAAIVEPQRYAIEPKVDGVPGLVAFLPGGLLETRTRRGERRQWLHRHPPAEKSQRSLKRLSAQTMTTVPATIARLDRARVEHDQPTNSVDLRFRLETVQTAG